MKRTDKAELSLVTFIAGLGLSGDEIKLLRAHIDVLKMSVEADTTEEVSSDILKRFTK